MRSQRLPSRTPDRPPSLAPQPTPSPPAPCPPMLTLQDQVGNRALLDVIAAGRDPLEVFPHDGTLRRLLGQAVPGEAVVDPAGCAARGVRAFTDGQTTHFRDAHPSLAVAAHEAAHLLQHAGLTRDAGLGAEAHAEAIAHRVVSGETAGHLLGAAGAPVGGPLHPYLQIPVEQQGPDATLGWTSPLGGGLRVSDDGHLAVPDLADTVSQAAWATAADINSANAVLTAQGSEVRLKPGAATLRGKAPDGDGAGPELVLSRVLVTEADGRQPMGLTGDCGLAAYEVMGGRDDGSIGAAVVRAPDGVERGTDPHPYANREAAGVGTTELWFREILRLAFGDLPLHELIARYEAQTLEERAAFEEQWGLNQHAVPEVGEAVTLGAFQDSPDFQRPSSGQDFYHWHFATAVLKSGHDYVTLESYAGNQPEQWYFSMFGPVRYGQSFYQQEAPLGVFGTETVGMVARAAGHARVTVTLTQDADTLSSAEVYVRLAGPGGDARAEPVSASAGEPARFVLPLASLLVSGESQVLWLDVFDQDLLGDEPLLSIPWRPPYASARYSDSTLTVIGEIVP